MSILNKIVRYFTDNGSIHSMASLENAIKVLSRDNEYADKVLECFVVDRSKEKVFQIGNVKHLLEDISYLDGDYAAFGRVLAGMDAVYEISKVKTDSSDMPLAAQKMETVRFVHVTKLD